MNFLLDWFEFLWDGLRQFIFGKHIESSPKPESMPKSELMPKPETMPKSEVKPELLPEIELLPKNELIIPEPTVEILPLELENGEGKVENTIYTEEQQKRKVKCTTKEGKNFEVPWCLMMQSKIFSDMWTNLGQEEKVMATTRKQGINAGNNGHNINNDEQNSIPEPFAFNLPTISEKCFRRIVDWMRHRHGQPEFELKFGKETGQQIWFKPDEWEQQFGFDNGIINNDLEEFYLAANYLDLPSLFHYCVQEFALSIINANKLEKVREMLCLADDLTDEEKIQIYEEFENIKIWEKETKIVGNLTKSLPAELVHPIFAKLSLSDQRWLLPLNRDAYKYLAERIRKNWPKWMNMLKTYFIEENPNWYYGYPTSANIPNLDSGQPSIEWTLTNLFANQPLQTEMLLTQNFVAQKFNSIEAVCSCSADDELTLKHNKNKHLKSILLRAIEHMDKLFRIETIFLEQLVKVSKRYANASSMNSYKRGLFHLVEERNQILEELETNGMKELKEKLADLEEDINEYWVQRL